MSAALDLVLAELAAARAKHPQFANSTDQTVTVLASEVGEYSSAVLRGDIDGPHGAIREATQVAAVAIRIIMYWTSRLSPTASVCTKCGNELDGFVCAAGHDTEGGRSGCLDWTPKQEAHK